MATTQLALGNTSDHSENDLLNAERIVMRIGGLSGLK